MHTLTHSCTNQYHYYANKWINCYWARRKVLIRATVLFVGLQGRVASLAASCSAAPTLHRWEAVWVTVECCFICRKERELQGLIFCMAGFMFDDVYGPLKEIFVSKGPSHWAKLMSSELGWRAFACWMSCSRGVAAILGFRLGCLDWEWLSQHLE